MAETNNLPKGFDIGKQYTPIQTEKQKIENRRRNKERWTQYDEEYRKEWSETSKRTMKEYWDSLTPEQREEEVIRRAEWWESKDEAYKKAHGAKAQVWRQDAKKVLAYRQKKIELGQWRDPKIYKEIYYKTLSYKRYNGSGVYKQLSKEYNIPCQTLYSIGCNYWRLINPVEHKNNIKKIQNEWDQLKEIREEERQKESQERQDSKFWFTWEFFSPGRGCEELYDYYNSKRTSNQKMPVDPSLVYFFRDEGMTAKEIKFYCKENDIYKSDDASYWHKLKKFKYPWYSTEESIKTTFDKTSEAVDFASKIFNRNCSYQWLHERSTSGLQKFGSAKGWIIRKVKKEEK